MCQMVKNLPAGDLGGEYTLEKGMQPTLILLSREFHGKSSLADYCLWGCKRVGHDSVTNTLYYTKLDIFLTFSGKF